MMLRGGRGRPRIAEAEDREEETQDLAPVTTMTLALRQRQQQTKLCESEVEGSKLLQDDGIAAGEDSELASAAAASCRICYGGAEKNNPLISPCQCRGTQAYIHRVRLWLQGFLDAYFKREPNGLKTDYAVQ